MTEIQDLPVPRHDAKLLLEDLACVCGTLSEIMTAWRRAMPWRPELPLSSLTALQDTTRQLAADIATTGRAGPRLDPALSMAVRFSVIKGAVADARATTARPVPLRPETADCGNSSARPCNGQGRNSRTSRQTCPPPANRATAHIPAIRRRPAAPMQTVRVLCQDGDWTAMTSPRARPPRTAGLHSSGRSPSGSPPRSGHAGQGTELTNSVSVRLSMMKHSGDGCFGGVVGSRRRRGRTRPRSGSVPG